MEMVINGIIFDNQINQFPIRVDDQNWMKVKAKLNYEQTKIIDFLKELHLSGDIKSIKRPKNKKIQKYLNELIRAKIEIKKSIKRINDLFFS